MRISRALDQWLVARSTDLATAGITAVAGRGPTNQGGPSATWISFETARAVGRAVLWSTGRCQLGASSHNGVSLCTTERDVTDTAQLDDALRHLTDCLVGPHRG